MIKNKIIKAVFLTFIVLSFCFSGYKYNHVINPPGIAFADITHDEVKKQKKMTKKPWRLVYYQGKVIAAFEGSESSVTTLPDWYEAEEFNTEDQMLNRIDQLGLTYIQSMESK